MSRPKRRGKSLRMRRGLPPAGCCVTVRCGTVIACAWVSRAGTCARAELYFTNAQAVHPRRKPDHTDAGCAALAAALDSGELPALESERLWLRCIASATAVNAVYVALENSRAAAPS